MGEWTPGPWVVESGGKSHKIMATTPRGLQKAIAQVGGYGGDSRPANAQLMAAAPKMYAALAAVADATYDELNDSASEVWGKVADAIAEATGVAPAAQRDMEGER